MPAYIDPQVKELQNNKKLPLTIPGLTALETETYFSHILRNRLPLALVQDVTNTYKFNNDTSNKNDFALIGLQSLLENKTHLKPMGYVQKKTSK